MFCCYHSIKLNSKCNFLHSERFVALLFTLWFVTHYYNKLFTLDKFAKVAQSIPVTPHPLSPIINSLHNPRDLARLSTLLLITINFSLYLDFINVSAETILPFPGSTLSSVLTFSSSALQYDSFLICPFCGFHDYGSFE